jgi:hypothetical protein
MVGRKPVTVGPAVSGIAGGAAGTSHIAKALGIISVIMLASTILIFHELRGAAIARGTVTASY